MRVCKGKQAGMVGTCEKSQCLLKDRVRHSPQGTFSPSILLVEQKDNSHKNYSVTLHAVQ